jgi:hypothetical protein
MRVNPLPRIELALRVLSTILLVVALIALVWTPGVSDTEIAPAGLDTPPAKGSPLAAIDPATAETIINKNVFSAARRAPAARYRMFASEAAPQPAVSAVPREPAVNEGERVPQLFGTVLGPRGPSALMRLDPALPDAQIYREGDSAGQYRVEKINERSVVLVGKRGRVTLYLKEQEN